MCLGILVTNNVLAQTSTIDSANADQISGTASAIGGNGIVDIAVRQGSLYWNGAAFQSGYKRIRVPLTGSNNSNWQYDFTPSLPDGRYVVSSRAIDSAGMTQSQMTIYRLTVDNVMPSISFGSFTETAITGTATDNLGVNRVELAIRNADSPTRFWNGSSFQSQYIRTTVPVNSDGTWSYSITPALPAGSYYIGGFAFDHGGNVKTNTTYGHFVGSTNVTATSSISHASASFLSGTATPASQLNRVELAIATATNPPAFWNGSTLSSQYSRVTARHTRAGKWVYDIDPGLPDGNYSVNSIAFLNNGQAQQVFGTRSLSVGNCGTTGNDGEGCATLIGRDSFTAGELAEFTIEFQAGASGIPVGGGVSFGFHHAIVWPVQILYPQSGGYAEVDQANASNLKLVRYPLGRVGMFADSRSGQNSDRIFHNQIVAIVKNTPILPGQKFQLRIGYNAQKVQVPYSVDLDHQIRVTTDIDGNGLFERIDRSPIFELKPATPKKLTAFVPAQAQKNTTVDVLIRVEDDFFNIAKTYSGFVEITDEQGNILRAGVPVSNGLANTTVNFSTTGPHRLRLQTVDAALSGRSNPVRIFNTMPAQKLYWADLHGHTGVSDGLGKDANEYFTYGRDRSKLDINALTDHSHNNWPANIQAVKDFYQPGEYVTILAQEVSARLNPSDHMNMYFRLDDTDHISTWPTDHSAFMEHTYNQYNTTQPEAITGPHHSGYDRGSWGNPDYPFRVWDDRIARFMEVYSSHGASEYENNPRPLRHQSSDPMKYMQGALDAGIKFSVIASTDNHDSKPGRSMSVDYPGGLAGIWATELTREAVWDAFWNYSTFATTIDRIYLQYSMNGEPMGSELNTSAVDIDAYIIGKTDGVTVELLRNNVVVQTYQSLNGVVDINYAENLSPGAYFYYLRVTQDNGEQAWSTPIWVNN